MVDVQLAQLLPLPYSQGSSTHYSDRLHDFSVTIPRSYKDVYVNSFLSAHNYTPEFSDYSFNSLIVALILELTDIF